MFKLINTNSEDYAPYFRQLRLTIREAKKQAQDAAGSGKVVTAHLIHATIFGNEVSSSAVVRYNTSVFKPNDKVECSSFTEDLVEGVNYSFGPLEELATAAAEEAESAIANAAMLGGHLEKDDIATLVTTSILSYLESIKVWDGYSVSCVIVAGGIQQVIITVA